MDEIEVLRERYHKSVSDLIDEKLAVTGQRDRLAWLALDLAGRAGYSWEQSQQLLSEAHGDGVKPMDTWCNCQAIPGTPNYPGPWHERGGEPHYPCSKASVAAPAQG